MPENKGFCDPKTPQYFNESIQPGEVHFILFRLKEIRELENSYLFILLLQIEVLTSIILKFGVLNTY